MPDKIDSRGGNRGNSDEAQIAQFPLLFPVQSRTNIMKPGISCCRAGSRNTSKRAGLFTDPSRTEWCRRPGNIGSTPTPKQRRGGPAESQRQIKNNSSDTAEKYQSIKNITGLDP